MEILAEQVVLEQPMIYLCRPDCKGLCPECGCQSKPGGLLLRSKSSKNRPFRCSRTGKKARVVNTTPSKGFFFNELDGGGQGRKISPDFVRSGFCRLKGFFFNELDGGGQGRRSPLT